MSEPVYGERLRIGMILPSANACAEPDAHAMLPPGVSMHVTRVLLTGTARDELLAMAAGAEDAARLLATARVGLVVFHCTAASTVDAAIGRQVVERIHRATGLPATATSEGLVAATRVLGARRVVMLSPYPQAVNDAEVAFFAANGVEVLAERGFLPPPGAGSPHAPPSQWLERAVAMDRPDADAFVLTCTNIRAIGAIEPLERACGKPVITSNQSMIWHALRSAGVTDAIPGWGRLLASH